MIRKENYDESKLLRVRQKEAKPSNWKKSSSGIEDDGVVKEQMIKVT